ncbi:hypothetical protein CC1G_02381 [Coprinopsis cinerea okayama7|uniref:GDP/GTP exchange factor Sec2 N-terminal domain-containing protein n=1 Tax=Coprinopsis cinerea (strain Okayama-7 / 130 / ATCC MYA-4618 / FGSC 9003) TaxID=240176 RepID=A8N7X4_COPC7|nr:hypothetical protein CC1G_02381 [Coprinopsis cinerea okayama7\|eukprot:XP_001830930.2 hypothetical protein CC1G_02381 [Coprinopsis cinerea okayama7\
MYHFPSTGASGLSSSSSSHGSSKSDSKHTSLNATQSKSASNPLFLKIEEELHDARRVRQHGQEDDLRMALDMVISRVCELSNSLSEAYKAQAELEVQLNVAKSNLQLVIMNNEMLEEALKKNNAAARDLGWRRSGRDSVSSNNGDPRGSLERSQSVDYPPDSPASAGSESRFFKFRFSGNSGHSSTRPNSRPGTPNLSGPSNLTSPSMPSLTTVNHAKEIEELTAELEKERAAKKKIVQEKAALEDELESLSQALFEEANKMVAQERMKLAETEEELKETRKEKEALQSALRLLDDQTRRRNDGHLRTSSSEFSLVDPTDHEGDSSSASGSSPSPSHHPSNSRTHSRSSSQIGVKSIPASPITLSGSSLPPLPPSPFPDGNPPQRPTTTSDDLTSSVRGLSLEAPSLDDGEEESQPTPRNQPSTATLPNSDTFPSSSSSSTVGDRILSSMMLEGMDGSSPWADVPSSATTTSAPSSTELASSLSESAASAAVSGASRKLSMGSGGIGSSVSMYAAYADMR